MNGPKLEPRMLEHYLAPPTTFSVTPVTRKDTYPYPFETCIAGTSWQRLCPGGRKAGFGLFPSPAGIRMPRLVKDRTA